MKIEFSRQCFQKTFKYQISWKSVVQWEQSCSIRTDGRKKLTVAFRNVGNAPKKDTDKITIPCVQGGGRGMWVCPFDFRMNWTILTKLAVKLMSPETRLTPLHKKKNLQSTNAKMTDSRNYEVAVTHSVVQKCLNILRTGSFKLFKRPFPGFLTI